MRSRKAKSIVYLFTPTNKAFVNELGSFGSLVHVVGLFVGVTCHS